MLLLPSTAAVAEPAESLGADFWWAPADLTDSFGVRITNPSETESVTVTFESASGVFGTAPLGPGDSLHHVLPSDRRPFPFTSPVFTTRNDLTLHVTSDGPVSVHVGNDAAFLSSTTGDITLLLPAPLLGTEHVVAAWHREIVGEPFIQLVATEDGTTYEVSDISGAVIDSGTLARFEERHLAFPSGTDVNGWRVTSDKPVAVFAGNLLANVGTRSFGTTCCTDHVLEQIWPVELLGRTFALVPFGHFPIGGTVRTSDAFHVVAVHDNTEVSTRPELGGGSLSAGEFVRIVTNENFILESSQPVLVAQFMASYDATLLASEPTVAAFGGDPSMTLVPSTDRFGCAGLVPVSVTHDPTALNFLDIVSVEGHEVTLNGQTILEPCEPIGEIDDESFCALRVPVAGGLHDVRSDGPVSVTVTSTVRFGSQIFPAWLAAPRSPRVSSSAGSPTSRSTFRSRTRLETSSTDAQRGGLLNGPRRHRGNGR